MSLLQVPKCKSCESPHRAELERRLLSGESPRAVAEWLEKTHGMKVSEPAVRNHKKTHMAIMDKAREVLAERVEAQQGEAVQKVVDSIDALDEVMNMGLAIARPLHRRLAKAVDPATPRPVEVSDDDSPAEPGDLVGMPEVVLFNGALKEVREAAKTKHQLLNGDNLNVNVDGLANFLAFAFPEADNGEDPDAPGPEAEPAAAPVGS